MSANLSSTANETQLSSCSGPANLTAEKLGKTLAYCLVLLVPLVGNFFIGIIVYRKKTMRKTFDFLIVNMAVSDLLYPMIVFPRVLTQLYQDSWLISGPLGHGLRKTLYFLQYVSSAVSIQSLVLIAVDRFGAVVFPLCSPFISSKLCRFFIFAPWILAMVVHSPYFVARTLVVYQEKLLCRLQWDETLGKYISRKDYYTGVFVFLAIIPFTLLTTLYSIILYKLKSQQSPSEQTANVRKRRVTRHKKVLKMAFAIVLGFAICWAPFNILAFLFFFVWEEPPQVSCSFIHFQFIAVFMARANCAINPCIYFVFSGNYSQYLKSLFCKPRGVRVRGRVPGAYPPASEDRAIELK